MFHRSTASLTYLAYQLDRLRQREVAWSTPHPDVTGGLPLFTFSLYRTRYFVSARAVALATQKAPVVHICRRYTH